MRSLCPHASAFATWKLNGVNPFHKAGPPALNPIPDRLAPGENDDQEYSSEYPQGNIDRLGQRRNLEAPTIQGACAAAGGNVSKEQCPRSVRIHAAEGPIQGHGATARRKAPRSEEHTSELQSLRHLVCRLLLENK